MNISSDLLAEATDLVLRIAPELASRPLYVVADDDLGSVPRASTPSNVFGWASAGDTIDFALAEAIPGWRGAGAIIALSSSLPDRESLLCCAIHEAAHIVPIPPPAIAAEVGYLHTCQQLDTPERRERTAGRVKEGSILADHVEVGSPADPHNAKFVRRAIHLWSRARLAGWPLPPDLWSGDSWYLSTEPHYIFALHDELHSLRSATFAEIEATRPPAEFSELWAGNLAFYQTFREQKK